MKRFLIPLLLLVSLLLTFASCGEEIPAVGGTPLIPPVTDGGDETPPAGDGEPTGETFTVTVMLNGMVYIPPAGSQIKVRWTDDKSSHTETLGADGTASATGLDGDYVVTLLNVPTGYSYNPNIYRASNTKSDVQIELIKIDKTLGDGTDLYKCKTINRSGLYRADISRAGQIVYYEFTPTKAGVYLVESMMDISANMYNPILKVYTGTHAAKFEQDEIDDGGVSGVYTKNFLYEISVAEEFLHNTFTFAIRVEGKDAVYPTYVDFTLSYAGTAEDYVRPDETIIIPEYIPSGLNYFDNLLFNVVDEAYLTEEDKNSITYTWMNRYREYLGEDMARFGSTWTDSAERVDGKKVFNEDGYKLNPDDEYYHVYDKTQYPLTDGWGPILYAEISNPNLFMENPLNQMEYAGNKALTVSEGKENYKLFVEGFHELTLRHGLSSGPYFCNDTCACYKAYQSAREAFLEALADYSLAKEQGITDLTSYVSAIRASRSNLADTNGGACDDTCKQCNATCRHIAEENVQQMGYADIAIGGRVPVTEEVKVFLQKLSESQRYFSDGNGWVESFGYTAFEDSQWLFACGYYK